MSDVPLIDPTLTLWSAPPEERTGRPLLVLLHGYGADERDLFGLVPYLPAEPVVAAVAAPLPPPFPAPGRSWYPIEGLHGRSPEGVTAAAASLLAWIDGLPERPASIGLLGFSQGAAVALQAMRLEPERFAFVVALSGYAAGGAMPRDAELRELRPPVFWGRGSNDDVIPAEAIDWTNQWLPDHSELSGRIYPGLTHSISEQELADIRRFLETRYEAPSTPGTGG